MPRKSGHRFSGQDMRKTIAARLIDHGQEFPTMTFKTPSRLGLAGLTLGVLFALCLCFIAFDVAFAEMAAPPAAPAAAAAAEPTVNKGDTAWMLSATVFVLLMTI